MVDAVRVVDLRSDTITRPTTVMRGRMAQADVGDDVFGEDPTILELEDRVSLLFDKESALFFPTGTMANLAAVMVWCDKRGSEMIMGDLSHIHIYEQGGVSQFGGVAMHILPTNKDGTLDLNAVESSIRPDNIHYPITQLITIENTHNFCGGKVLTPEYMDSLAKLAGRYGVPVHLDGARIFNAASALRRPLTDFSRSVDSLAVCLSKGLGAPAGTVLVGSKSFISKARRVRKALGGGLRQGGILAAAGLQALDDFEAGILDIDHARAKQLARLLSNVPGLDVDPREVETNIIVVNFDIKGCSVGMFVETLKDHGVLVLPRGNRAVRVVFHRDVMEGDVEIAATSIIAATNKLLAM